MKQIAQTEQIAKSVEVFYMNKQTWQATVRGIQEEETERLLKSTGFEGFVRMVDFDSKSNKSFDEMAEEMFALLNDGMETPNPLGTPEGQQFIRNNGVGHTSMSVGDFIIFNEETIYICAGCGWNKMSVSEVAVQ